MTDRRILVVGIPQHIYQKLRPALRDGVVEIQPRAVKAMEQVCAMTYAIIILGYPLVGADVGDVLKVIKSGNSACVNTSILLLCMPGKLEEAVAKHGVTVTRILGMEEKPAVLQAALRTFHRMSPRVAFRILAQVRCREGARPDVILSQMENLSLGGALLRSGRLFPVGTPVVLDFMLPLERNRLCIEAEVVRHMPAQEDREPAMGLKFLAFEADAQERLQAFLERKM